MELDFGIPGRKESGRNRKRTFEIIKRGKGSGLKKIFQGVGRKM